MNYKIKKVKSAMISCGFDEMINHFTKVNYNNDGQINKSFGVQSRVGEMVATLA